MPNRTKFQEELLYYYRIDNQTLGTGGHQAQLDTPFNNTQATIDVIWENDEHAEDSVNSLSIRKESNNEEIKKVTKADSRIGDFPGGSLLITMDDTGGGKKYIKVTVIMRKK